MWLTVKYRSSCDSEDEALFARDLFNNQKMRNADDNPWSFQDDMAQQAHGALKMLAYMCPVMLVCGNPKDSKRFVRGDRSMATKAVDAMFDCLQDFHKAVSVQWLPLHIRYASAFICILHAFSRTGLAPTRMWSDKSLRLPTRSSARRWTSYR